MKRNLTLIESKQETGITLLALVITIIILLILAGITISAITGDNGIIGNAGQAKEETEIANEKEIVEKATVQAMGNNKYGNIVENELQSELDKETGEGKTETTDIGDEIEVLFKESKRYYLVDKNGNVEGEYTVIEDKNPGDITVGKDGEELDGSEEEPYEIWCIEDLVTFSNMVNGEGIRIENGNSVEIKTTNNFKEKYVVLKTDLNFESELSYQDSERTDFGDINGNKIVEGIKQELTNKEENSYGFLPIGTTSIAFSGTFDGNNNEIKNIYEKSDDNNISLGLFGSVSGSKIININISGEMNIVNPQNSSYISAGGIAGKGYGTFINCTNKVNIKGSAFGMGGILGRSINGNIELKNCSNMGELDNSSESTGGIVGRSENDIKLYNSYNLGNLIGTGHQIGGIVGYIPRGGEIINVYNYGEITKSGPNGRSGIVGAVGFSNLVITVNLKYVYNLGKVVNGSSTRCNMWAYI